MDTSDLYEIVFEGLDEASAVDLCESILGRDLGTPTEDSAVSEAELDVLPLAGGLSLRRVHLRLLRYEGAVFDVELNFTLKGIPSCDHAQIGDALHDRALQLAASAGVQSFYAGLEPAADEDTRLFTGQDKGPYSLAES